MMSASLLVVMAVRVFSRQECVNMSIEVNNGTRSALFVWSANSPLVPRVLFLERISWSACPAMSRSMLKDAASAQRLLDAAELLIRAILGTRSASLALAVANS